VSFDEAPLPALTDTTGAYPLDVDGDGMIDIAVRRVGPDVLLRGTGACGFVEATADLGLVPTDAWTTAFAATWEDGNALPTLAFGHYVDRFDPEGPFEACDTSDLYRPEGRRYGAAETIAPGYCALSMLITDWRR